MYEVIDFVNWLKTHTQNGAEPWVYLMGTSGHKVTQKLLDAKYKSVYHKKMTREQYDALTAGWVENKRIAADCQGLADAYCTQVLGVPTEVTSNANYTDWCTHKGSVKKIDRPYVLGEAVFMAHANGRVHHVGFVCGFDGDEPLVIEARGIYWGVVTTRLHDRPWTHRGLMTRIFHYEGVEPEMIIFENVKPMRRGEPYLKMQEALKAAGYPDADGKPLVPNGIWGPKSQAAFSRLLEAHILDLLEEPIPASEPIVFELKDKMMQGSAVKALQLMLIEAGYKDANGDALKADGKLGKKTWAAFTAFLQAHGTPAAAPAELPEEIVAGAIINDTKYSGLLLKQKE